MAFRIMSFETPGLVVRRGRREPFTIAYSEILTAERLRSPRRGLRLHTRTREPVILACGRERLLVETELRDRGVRIVDCWGCILAPSLEHFEAELMNKPVRLRQSSDSG